MPSRNRTPRYVVFALTGLIVSLIAVGVDGAPSRLRAALSKPESTPQASLARDGEDFMRVAELRPVDFGTAKAGTRSADAVVLEADAACLNVFVRTIATGPSTKNCAALSTPRTSAACSRIWASPISERGG